MSANLIQLSVMDDWHHLDRSSFGDSPQMADALLTLVVAGQKTATCWSAVFGDQGACIGRRWVVEDGAGQPRAFVETVELTRRPFCEVDAAFAFDEGEGDRTLKSWRAAHLDFFTRNGGFAPDMLLWCERFRLIRAISSRENMS